MRVKDRDIHLVTSNAMHELCPLPRVKRICSDENDYKTKCEEMTSIFLQRDYPLAVVDRALQHVDTIPR